MGGHGALICALKNPGMFRSVSAFAPICNPIKCPWGQKAFTGYLGTDTQMWEQYDATSLIAKYSGPSLELFVDQVYSLLYVCVWYTYGYTHMYDRAGASFHVYISLEECLCII